MVKAPCRPAAPAPTAAAGTAPAGAIGPRTVAITRAVTGQPIDAFEAPPTRRGYLDDRVDVCHSARLHVLEAATGRPGDAHPLCPLWTATRPLEHDPVPLTRQHVHRALHRPSVFGVARVALDALGAVGGNARAESEWVDLSAMAPRATLLAALLRRVLTGANIMSADQEGFRSVADRQRKVVDSQPLTCVTQAA